jgi:hypothetical protein
MENAVKKYHYLALLIVIALSLSACGSPKADIEVVFTKDNCEYTGPNGAVDNPITVHVVNKTNAEDNFNLGASDDYALIIATMKNGFTKADLEAHQRYSAPESVDNFVEVITFAGEERTEEFELETGQEHFIICARQSGVISVPAVITPK